MYGTCETLCRELAAKYPGDTPLMLVIWSPEEIQALADGMDISLSDHEIRHCCKVSDEAAFCLIQRPYISKTLLTRRISPRGSP